MAGAVGDIVTRERRGFLPAPAHGRPQRQEAALAVR